MEPLLPLFTALWLGILTSISPCPLASNIAAITFVSHRVAHRTTVLLSGIFYTIGRSFVYTAISFIIVKAIVAIPSLSFFLQRYMNKLLGILLVLVGMILLGLLTIPFPSLSPSQNLQKRLDHFGVAGSFLLGAFFALAFCPISAALFFGSLIPLAIKVKSSVALPTIYGIGTAVPVLFFAIVIIAGASYVNKLYHSVTAVEFYAKKITGGVLIVVGIYYILVYIFGVF